MWKNFVGKLKRVFKSDDNREEGDPPAQPQADNRESRKDPKKSKKTIKPVNNNTNNTSNESQKKHNSKAIANASVRKKISQESVKTSKDQVKTTKSVQQQSDHREIQVEPSSVKTARVDPPPARTPENRDTSRKDNQSNKTNDRQQSSRSSKEGGNSSNRINSFIGDVSKRAKQTFRFKSRNISEKKLAKWSEKIEQRKQKRNSASTVSTRTLSNMDVTFPSISLNSKKTQSCVSQDSEAPPRRAQSKGNVNKDGSVLLENGLPFWFNQGDDETPTNDDIPLNADVVLDVYVGKVKLVPMPSIPIRLDPMSQLEQLTCKDAPFFNKDVLFGNTVRTMVNATENGTTVSSDDRSSLDRSLYNQQSDTQLAPHEAAKKKTKRRSLKFREPTHMIKYKSGELGSHKRVSFVASKRAARSSRR